MKIGFIGGSGLYELESELTEVHPKKISTPFGEPSDELVCGVMHGVDVVFMPRHGRGHKLLPGELNHRANIYAMKSLGVTHILSLSACGSLQEKYKPRDIVIIDQYVDRTKRSADHTFFGNGIAGHIEFAEPVCPELSQLAYEASETVLSENKSEADVHMGGTYLNMEGPAFSTRAESNLYRSWGMDIIGMTNMAEAKLAREAAICYSTLAMVTDYDCWHPSHESVTLDMIIGNLNANTGNAKQITKLICKRASELVGNCKCANSAKFAVITDQNVIPEQIKKDLAPIFFSE
jgi:5'-methylthioadenosine phosphorylase